MLDKISFRLPRGETKAIFWGRRIGKEHTAETRSWADQARQREDPVLGEDSQAMSENQLFRSPAQSRNRIPGERAFRLPYGS